MNLNCSVAPPQEEEEIVGVYDDDVGDIWIIVLDQMNFDDINLFQSVKLNSQGYDPDIGATRKERSCEYTTINMI